MGCNVYSLSQNVSKAPGRAASRCQASRAVKDRLNTQSRSIALKPKARNGDDFENTPNRRYINFTGAPFPIGPLAYRKTTCKEILPGVMWSFEQPQSLAFSTLTVNIRMTVTRLSTGDLLVYNPIAPTPECLNLLAQLDAPVKYIILAVVAYEHKIFVGPFSRRFPAAEVHVSPAQWSFPLDLPVQFYGIFPKGVLKHNDDSAPWSADFEQKVLQPPKFAKIGLYAEVAMFHRPSKTLLVTDSVVQLPKEAPACVSVEALLDNARQEEEEEEGKGDTPGHSSEAPALVSDTPANRRLGWLRICLQVCFIKPENEEQGFRRCAGRPIVSPVISALVYSRCKGAVRDWIDDICECWDFQQIVPSHFAAPFPCNPRGLLAAFKNTTDVYPSAQDVSASAAPQEGGGLLQRILGLGQGEGSASVSLWEAADVAGLEDINLSLEKIDAVNKREEADVAG